MRESKLHGERGVSEITGRVPDLKKSFVLVLILMHCYEILLRFHLLCLCEGADGSHVMYSPSSANSSSLLT